MDSTRAHATTPTGPSGFPLELSFTPDAIRSHFDGDDPFDALLDTMNDDVLARIGEVALRDDRLYTAFHQVLVAAITDAVVEAS